MNFKKNSTGKRYPKKWLIYFQNEVQTKPPTHFLRPVLNVSKRKYWQAVPKKMVYFQNEVQTKPPTSCF